LEITLLHITPFENFSKKQQALEAFDSQSQTWLVGDLRSKFEIQKLLLQKHGFLAEDAVLRASELWAKWAFRLAPEFRIVSSDYMRGFLSQFLAEQDLDFARSPGAPQTLMAYVGQLLPVLADPSLGQQMEEWFHSQEKSFLRWRHWYELSKRAWAALSHKRIITSRWCSGLVVARWQHHGAIKASLWSRDLVCDLSGQFSMLEAEILKMYSSHREVQVFKPSASWMQRYEKTLMGYAVLEGHGLTGASVSQPFPVPTCLKDMSIERYATTLSEIKSTVAKVRELLDGGCEPSEIAITAPDIELYWPALFRYLQREGIPFSKPVMERLSAYASIESWLAKLRLKVGQVSSSDLERVYYDRQSEENRIGYDKFKRLFSLIYDESDLARSQSLKKIYSAQFEAGKEMSFEQFLSFAIGHWNERFRLDELATVIKRLLADVTESLNLQAQQWLEYVESIVANEEVMIEEPHAGGVEIVNTEELEWLDCNFIYVLGFDAAALNEYSEAALTFQDVKSLSESIGVFLDRPDHARKELQCVWVLNQKRKQITLSFSATDFKGTPCAPHVYWLVLAYNQGRDIEEFSSTIETRWDELQQADFKTIAEERGVSEQQLETLTAQMRIDLGAEAPKTFAGDLAWSLSASQLEKYAQCPFQFAAEKLFGLSDLPDVDLDLDVMTKGSFVHKLFQELTTEPMRFDWSDDELRAIVRNLPESTKSPIGDPELWAKQEGTFLKLARRFLANEKELREKFPNTETRGRELPIEIYWSEEHGKFQSQSEGGILFRGFVDRVDVSKQSGKAIVVDYKSSDSSYPSYSTWQKHKIYQLALYSMALESGLTMLEIDEVIAAFYYSAKTMNRQKGFRLKEEVGDLYEAKSNRSELSREQKVKLFEEIRNEISEMILQMKQGQMNPQPLKEETCNKCSWSQQCRAPHLN
jgi:ATP-dependent helicase/nuclease subunit B